MRACVIVPMYNEEAIAEYSIETILRYTKQLPPIVTVLAVDDGSQDNTGDILKSLSDRYKESELQVISNSVNRGYGGALKAGINYVIRNDYDYVVFMDSDLTNHPEYLKAFYEKMIEGWDYIKATRYAKKCGPGTVPWRRRIISRCGNIFARIVTGCPLTDITNGFRAVKVDILKQLHLTEDHFSIIIEELMKARKVTNSFCEIYSELGTRTKETGVSKFTYDLSTFWKYTKYLFI